MGDTIWIQYGYNGDIKFVFDVGKAGEDEDMIVDVYVMFM